MAEQDLGKRKRASKPKTRGGCWTCKARRVKCDEGKPACNRCVKSGVKCGGYDRPNYKQRPPRPLLPTFERIGHQTEKWKDRHFLTILPFAPGRALFDDEHEYRYFRLFCDFTTSSLSGYFSEPLWAKIVLQACEHTIPIRHAVIAIGALHQTFDTFQKQNSIDSSQLGDQQLEGSTHHQFALQRYGKAIREMGEGLSSNRQDTRSALIFCLLTVCFEAWNGNIQTALAQIHHGVKLIEKWQDEQPHERQGDGHAFCQVLNHLENLSIMSLDREFVDYKPQIKPGLFHAIQQMPDIFSSIDEARLYYDGLLRSLFYTVKLGYYTYEIINSVEKETDFPQDESEMQEIPPGEQLRARWEGELPTFHRWHEAFAPLLQRARLPGHEQDFTAATALELRYTASYNCLAAQRGRDELSFDSAYQHFETVVELAETLTDLEKAQDENSSLPKAGFTFDISIVPSLYVVAAKCRDPYLRRRAIQLLEEKPRRECMWDSAISARIARLAMEIEEEGMIDGFVPESARLRGIGTTYNMTERWGTMTYLRFNNDSGEGVRVREIVEFTW